MTEASHDTEANKVIEPVALAAREVGGIAELARRLSVRPQTFYQWKSVPAKRVLEIEAATEGKVTRHQMRPDLYPREAAA